MQVWKYPVYADRFEVEMPRGAEVLSVGLQGIPGSDHGGIHMPAMVLDPKRLQFGNVEPWMWVLVDPTAERVTRRFVVVNTGDPVPDNGRFVGTVSLMGGRFIVHLFDLGAA